MMDDDPMGGARMVAYLLLTLAAELLIVGGLLVWLWVGA